MVPPEPAPRRWATRKLDPFVEATDVMLREDMTAPRKQRHTARRVHARLLQEHAAVVSYSSVRDYVAVRRPEIAAKSGAALEETFVPPDGHAGQRQAAPWPASAS